VTIEPDGVLYALDREADDGVDILHCGEPIRLSPGSTEHRPLQPIEPLTERPRQPAGRAPISAAELS
jgi:hypothetical protein